METKSVSELARNNKMAMVFHQIISTVMVMFCILQTLSGAKTLLYLVIMLILGFMPVIAEHICWKRNHDTKAIKHLIVIGFAIFYTAALFTSTSNMVYAFVIPLMMVVTTYQDVKYFILINAGTILESLIIVILGSQTGGFGYLGLDAAIIQVVVMILVGVATIYVSNTNQKNTAQKLENVVSAQTQTEEALKNISTITDTLERNITAVYDEVGKLKASSQNTKDVMEKLSSGAKDTTSAVHKQSTQTEAIQGKVGQVDSDAIRIAANMQKTLDVLDIGSKNMEELQKQVEISVQNSQDAAQKLELLDSYMQKMNSIVEIISEITSQTNLLALNAGIEAARAGDAGRGFSVVAKEISRMAGQTEDATKNISELIKNVSLAIVEVVRVIQQMIDGITEEKQSAKDAVESFSAIQNSTYAVHSGMDNMVKNAEELNYANQKIVDSIQTILEISQEVAAYANETLAAEQENAQILDRISERMAAMAKLEKR